MSGPSPAELVCIAVAWAIGALLVLTLLGALIIMCGYVWSVIL